MKQERSSLPEEVLTIPQKDIIRNMQLADMATGIDYNPKPVEVTPPLISNVKHKTENPHIPNYELSFKNKVVESKAKKPITHWHLARKQKEDELDARLKKRQMRKTGPFTTI